eukprot:g3332.t1
MQGEGGGTGGGGVNRKKGRGNRKGTPKSKKAPRAKKSNRKKTNHPSKKGNVGGVGGGEGGVKKNKSSHGGVTLQNAVDNVMSRFVLSWPEEIPLDSTRLFFQLEQAHWFYEDFFADKYEHLPHFHNLKAFCSMVFKKSMVFPKSLKSKFVPLYKKFIKYRAAVPSFGAILVNSDRTKILLVESWMHHVWGFPKGKINEGEGDASGAIREVKEEIGYDIAPLLKEDEFIELSTKKKVSKLFIICGVSEKHHFSTQVRKEIRSLRWFKIGNLLNPKWHEKNQKKGNWANVVPFVKQLERWKKDVERTQSMRPGEVRELLFPESGGRDSGKDGGGWNQEDMIATNERILGTSSEFEGDPQTFDEVPSARAQAKKHEEEATENLAGFSFDREGIMRAFRGRA